MNNAYETEPHTYISGESPASKFLYNHWEPTKMVYKIIDETMLKINKIFAIKLILFKS